MDTPTLLSAKVSQLPEIRYSNQESGHPMIPSCVELPSENNPLKNRVQLYAELKIKCYSTPCINFLIGLLSTAINTAIPINTKPIVEKTDK